MKTLAFGVPSVLIVTLSSINAVSATTYAQPASAATEVSGQELAKGSERAGAAAKQICLPLLGCLKVPVPREIKPSVDGFLQHQVYKSLANALGEGIPITSSANQVFPTTNVLPGGSFQPKRRIPQISSDGLMRLKPGDYNIPVDLFCMKQRASSPSGHRYLLAPLKGKMAKVITALNARAVGTGIPRQSLQVLSWNIQGGMKYEEMSSENRQIVDRLLPDYKRKLSRSLLEEIEITYNQLAPVAGLPSLNSALGRLGDVGKTINSFRQVRQDLITYGDDYSSLARLFITPGNSNARGGSANTPWSKISDRVYGRMVTEGNVSSPGELQLRVLPTSASPVEINITSLVAEPQNSNIQPLTPSPKPPTNTSEVEEETPSKAQVLKECVDDQEGSPRISDETRNKLIENDISVTIKTPNGHSPSYAGSLGVGGSRKDARGRPVEDYGTRLVNFILIGCGQPTTKPRKTWVVTHGWNNDFKNGDLADVAQAIHKVNKNDRVLFLDWGQAAHNQGVWGTGNANLGNYYAATWIRPVAESAVKKLKELGIDDKEASSNLNFVGHSLGSIMSAEMASQYANGVNTIIALDPPSEINSRADGIETYDVDGRTPAYDTPYPHLRTIWRPENIDAPKCFSNVSQTAAKNAHCSSTRVARFTRAFVGKMSSAGNQQFAATADESFQMDFGLRIVLPGTEHGDVVKAFINLISKQPFAGFLGINDNNGHKNMKMGVYEYGHEGIVYISGAQNSDKFNPTSVWVKHSREGDVVVTAGGIVLKRNSRLNPLGSISVGEIGDVKTVFPSVNSNDYSP